jgi:predicted DNA-binding transcriptional regulator AlpA
VRAAARFLRRSVSWVYHKAEDGTLPVKRLGGWGLRFMPSELRAWVDAGDARRPPRVNGPDAARGRRD